MADNGADGNGWKGKIEEKVAQLETWKRDHYKEHETMRQEMQEATRRNDRWSGALAVLIAIFGLVGPLLVAKLMKQ